MNWVTELYTPFNLWRSQYNINENINPCNENREYSNDIKNNKCENFILNLSTNEYQIDNEEALDYNLLNINISNGLNPNQSSWDEISDLAFRTYVPESEESREKGAGGGDAND